MKELERDYQKDILKVVVSIMTNDHHLHTENILLDLLSDYKREMIVKQDWEFGDYKYVVYINTAQYKPIEVEIGEELYDMLERF